MSGGAIGIDIGTRAIKAVQLDAAGAIARSAHFTRLSPDLDEEAVRIGRVLEQRGFAYGSACVAAPRPVVASAVLGLPPKHGRAPRREIARREIARVNGLQESGLEIAIQDLPAPIRAGGGEQQALVWACTHQAVEALLTLGDHAPLRIEGVHVASRGLASLAGDAGKAEEATVLVDIGWMGSTVMVLLGSRLVFERPVHSGGITALLEQAMERGVSMETIEACLRGAEPTRAVQAIGRGVAARLNEEIERSLSFVQGRYPLEYVRRVFVTGGGAPLLIPGGAAELELGRSVDCRVLPVPDGRHPALAPAFAMACIAADRGHDGAAEMNMIPAPRLAERSKRRVTRRWAVACGFAAAASATATVAARGIAEQGEHVAPWQIQELEDELEQTTLETAGSRAQLAKAGQQLRRTRQVGGHPDWSVLMRVLERCAGDRVVLQEFGIEPGGEGDTFTLSVSGLARDQSSVAQFALSLDASGVVDAHRLNGTRRAAFQGAEGVGFDLVATLGTSRAPVAPQRDASEEVGP